MSERATARGSPSNLPISFRMPSPLRSRLRRFAEERSLGEAEAIRLALSEHLNEIDDEREVATAERWQFKQAYATWQKTKPGEARPFTTEAIDRIFARARTQGPARRRRAKS